MRGRGRRPTQRRPPPGRPCRRLEPLPPPRPPALTPATRPPLPPPAAARYIEHGSYADQLAEAGLTAAHIASTACTMLGKPKDARFVINSSQNL